MKQLLKGCGIVLLVAASIPAHSDSMQTITQIAEVHLDTETVYVSVVESEDDGVKVGRILIANPETMEAVTIMVSDADSLARLSQALDEAAKTLAHAEQAPSRLSSRKLDLP